MGRLIQMSYPIVHPIDRDQILNQVVGADAEKSAFFRQDVCGHGGTRNLNHGAHDHFFVKRRAPLAQLTFAFLKQRICLGQFFGSADHGIH